MKEQFLDAWRTHQRMNRLLLSSLTLPHFAITLSTRGGRTIYQQWVHVLEVRIQWLEICAPGPKEQYTVPDKNSDPDQKLLIKALEATANAIEALLAHGWDNQGKVKGYKKGVFVLLGYFISHESHHRGNTLLSLKQAGVRIPDEVRWGIWKWD